MKIQADLSVCTYFRGSFDYPEKLLSSLYTAADPVALEVIVVDMSEGSGQALLKSFPEIILYENPSAENSAQAINRALDIASGRYLSIWDNDVIASPDSLYKLLTFLDENPDIGIVAPKILNAYGNPEPTCRTFHSPLSLLAAYAPTFVRPLLKNFHDRHTVADFSMDEPRETDWLCSGVHLFRREIFEEIGFFDERLGTIFDMMDYYLRAKKSGWHNFYYPDADAVHARADKYYLDLATKDKTSKLIKDSLLFLKKKWFNSEKYYNPYK